jgi:hypothetical protein
VIEVSSGPGGLWMYALSVTSNFVLTEESLNGDGGEGDGKVSVENESSVEAVLTRLLDMRDTPNPSLCVVSERMYFRSRDEFLRRSSDLDFLPT